MQRKTLCKKQLPETKRYQSGFADGEEKNDEDQKTKSGSVSQICIYKLISPELSIFSDIRTLVPWEGGGSAL